MKVLQLRPMVLGITALIIGAIIVIIEILFTGPNHADLLFTLTFWIALIQGPVAVAAAADISRGSWAEPLKKELLSFYPLILFMAFLFLFLSFHMGIYKWTNMDHKWLNKPFFIWRNFTLLVISFLLAHFYARASLQKKESRGTLAVLFILSFVTVQSMVAFDWIMSLDYPWISTMFGPIFFMESFYAGLALASIISAYLITHSGDARQDFKKVMRDSALFMFGISLAWAGLYYGQYLVVWYGNIPWETDFFSTRMNHLPFKVLMYLVIFVLFIFPFVGLISKKSKTSRGWVTLIALVVLTGLLLERIFYILPVAPLNVFWLIVEFILMGILLLLFFTSRNKMLALIEK
jgi:hypothetical protein